MELTILVKSFLVKFSDNLEYSLRSYLRLILRSNNVEKLLIDKKNYPVKK